MHFNETVWPVYLFIITDSELKNSEFQNGEVKRPYIPSYRNSTRFFSLATHHGYKNTLNKVPPYKQFRPMTLGH